MKNIRKIAARDIKSLGGSIVTMIIIMGLCVVPCLYAWFNTFSNWNPYEQSATSRIAVVVANEDAGDEMLGFRINIGDKVTEALGANKDIGWVFADSREEALEGVKASDYYAALIIPKDFSRDVMSFISGKPENPTIIYYENEKKNAIAPKITGKARTAVVEEVNATFVSTLAKYISEAAATADATGNNPASVLGELSERLNDMSGKLDNALALIAAVDGLSSSSQNLLNVSDDFVGGIQDTIGSGQDLLGEAEKKLPKAASNDKKVTAAVRKNAKDMYGQLEILEKDIDVSFSDMESYNKLVESDLEARKSRVLTLQQSAAKQAEYLRALGSTVLAKRFSDVADRLGQVYERLDKLEKATTKDWAQKRKNAKVALDKDFDFAKTELDSISRNASIIIDNKIDDAVAEIQDSLRTLNSSLSATYGNLGELSTSISNYASSLDELEGGLEATREALQEMQRSFTTMSGLFDRIADSNALNNINGIFDDDSEAVASYLSSPVKMDTEVVYPIREYGSAMAPFYTVLAQWIGSLLAACFIKVRIKKSSEISTKLRVHERFFGRYAIFMLIGLAQAIIVSMGELFYVGISCRHRALFVLAALINGIVFMMINYALVFALDNIGMAAAVLVLVVQVAGSGGTYPVEVVPEIFQRFYPLMPFRYAMGAMRECIGGMYGNDYLRDLAMLGIFCVVFTVFGLLMYRPALWLNRMIAESKSKSEIML